MVFLTPHQRFILKALPTEEDPEKEIDIIEFYIEFGFCHRATAEETFRKAITKLVDLDVVTADQKEYVKEVYLDDDCDAVFNTDKFNKYWALTERIAWEDQILKRKEQTLMNQVNETERRVKRRKATANIEENNIYDLSKDEDLNRLNVTFVTIRNNIKAGEAPLPKLPTVIETAITSNFKKGVYLGSKFKNLTGKVLRSTSSNKSFYKILAHIVESHQMSPNIFVIPKLSDFSAMDINVQFWSRIFQLLFPASSCLQMKLVEKNLECSTVKIKYNRGCVFKDKFVTLSCIEGGEFVDGTKIRDDHRGLLLEGNIIIGNIIRNFPFVHPEQVPVFNLRICGLEGDFVEIILINEKEFLAHRPLNRFRAPLNCHDSKTTSTFIRQLVYYKNYIEKLHSDINQMIKENDVNGEPSRKAFE